MGGGCKTSYVHTHIYVHNTCMHTWAFAARHHSYTHTYTHTHTHIHTYTHTHTHPYTYMGCCCTASPIHIYAHNTSIHTWAAASKYNTYIYIHAQIHTCIHGQLLQNITEWGRINENDLNVHTYIHTYIHTYMNACINKHIHAYTCIHTLTAAEKHYRGEGEACMHRHTYTHIYMHTYIDSCWKAL